MKRVIALILSAAALICLLCGCSLSGAATINNVKLSDYTIVFDGSAPDYCRRAAEYLQSQILARTGTEISVHEVDDGTYAHEIVVGETSREISQKLDAQTDGLDFAILADENHIALEGDYFIIAAAAYYFVQTYITGEKFAAQVPTECTVASPITEKADNFFFLIGDGMGEYQSRIPEYYDLSEYTYDTDGEDIFYGRLLPYQGYIHTGSLSGTTDSAAGGTALACGTKTINHYVGVDENGNALTSLTELAISLGKSTAVVSTDLQNGATPAAFSAHAMDRDDTTDILACQAEKMQQGTVILGGLQSTARYEDMIMETIGKIEDNEKGFFMMYEEGYIDKFCHKSQLEHTCETVARFNQAIGRFMEYAFYHPNTFLLITADHETGGLLPNENGELEYHSDGTHTGADVPIFAYGQGAEVFDGYLEENTEVSKVIAALWGVDNFGN